MEIEPTEEACIAELFGFKGKKKKNTKPKPKPKQNAETVPEDSAPPPPPPAANDNNGADDEANANATGPDINNGGDNDVNINASNSTSSSSSGRVRVSPFDLSIENFFRYIDTVAALCGEEDQNDDLDNSEIQRFSSSVTFLREWRDFNYPPRSIRFGYRCGSSESSKGEDCGAINLPQFSSATVPKYDMQSEEQPGDAKSQESRDFVMYVGGPVWALDWCPRIHEKPACSIKCEFIAVATHPPGSSYHKLGAPLTGRGVIQIWCLLNIREQDEEARCLTGKRKKKPKKDGGTNDKSTQIKRPRGRPRKNPIQTSVDDTNSEAQYMPALAVQFPENSAAFHAPDGIRVFPATDKSKRGPKRNEGSNEKSAQINRPRGRPRKNSKEVIAGSPNSENQSVQAVVAVQGPEDSAELISSDAAHGNCKEPALQQTSVAKQKRAKKAASACHNMAETRVKTSRLKINHREGGYIQDIRQPLLTQSENESTHKPYREGGYNQDISQPLLTQGENESTHQPSRDGGYNQDISQPLLTLGENDQDISQPLLMQGENESSYQPNCSSGLGLVAAIDSLRGDLTLPRVVLCLAHNGKVAWDVKWRPPNISNSISKHRMGYLAVVLGNGSLEVWEVPLPRVLKAIYMQREGIDPRFIKLKPVFKCSMLKRGGMQSIPLTVEWSVTPPHDYLLAGCHDGTVALWKFSPNALSKCDDTKPVLCFSGDTSPIRAVAWAPFEGDPESSNIIVTAGHEGLKFWDLRNPFHPLRNLQPVPRVIYSLDWLSKPSCIIMSFEDGTMKTISLVKAANELPVSGKTYTGKKQPWLHSSSLSSYAIWSVHVSLITGMVAYCGVDGTAFRYQLTTKAVETDNAHNRVPYFLCGSITEEESTLKINSPVSNTPFPLKKSNDKVRHAQSFRELLSKSRKCADDEKMAKASIPHSQTLALCDGDDSGLESGSEEALSSAEQPKRPKLSSSNKKKAIESKALVCKDDVSTSTPGDGSEKSDFGNIPEVFPSKMVALHRVRWNMNKGSERWLCFGGAGGIVRCQEIVYSDADKKWALKR